MNSFNNHQLKEVKDFNISVGSSVLWCSQIKCFILIDCSCKTIYTYHTVHNDKISYSDKMELDENLTFAVPTLKTSFNGDLYLLVGLEDRIVEINFSKKKIVKVISMIRDLNFDTGRFVEAKCSPEGTLITGFINHKHKELSKTRMYYLNSFNELTKLLPSDRLSLLGGSVWYGYEYYYIVDSGTNKVLRYRWLDCDGTKSFTDRKVVFKLPKDESAMGYKLSGITIDCEGKIWVGLSGAGCLIRIDPDSKSIINRLSLPSKHPVSCTFGGEKLSDLLIVCNSETHDPSNISPTTPDKIYIAKIDNIHGIQGSILADIVENYNSRPTTPINDKQNVSYISQYFLCAPVFSHFNFLSEGFGSRESKNLGTESDIYNSETSNMLSNDFCNDLEYYDQIFNEDNHIKSDVSLNHIEDNETKFKDHSIICNINSSCDLEILSSVLNNQESLEKGLACQQFDEMEEKYIVYGGRRTPII